MINRRLRGTGNELNRFSMLAGHYLRHFLLFARPKSSDRESRAEFELGNASLFGTSQVGSPFGRLPIQLWVVRLAIPATRVLRDEGTMPVHVRRADVIKD